MNATINLPGNNLYTTVCDRTATQLAYKVRCFPWAQVPAAGKELVSWRRGLYLTKAQILLALDEDMTKLVFKLRDYTVVWAFNNIPTEQEWERKSDTFLIYADFRFSPAVKEHAVVVLDFELGISHHMITSCYPSSNH